MSATTVALTRPRRISTGGLGVIHLVLAFAYSQPGLSIAPPSTPGAARVSIVTYINQLGPIWLIAFGVTGTALVAAMLLFPRSLAWAHVGGVLVCTTYSFALWAGFALSAPRPTIISSVLSISLVLWHIAMSDLYAAHGVPRRRRHAA